MPSFNEKLNFWTSGDGFLKIIVVFELHLFPVDRGAFIVPSSFSGHLSVIRDRKLYCSWLRVVINMAGVWHYS